MWNRRLSKPLHVIFNISPPHSNVPSKFHSVKFTAHVIPLEIIWIMIQPRQESTASEQSLKYRTRDFSMMSFMWSRTQIDYSKTSKHNLLISFLSRCVAAHHFFHCLDSCTWTQHMMLIDDLLFSLLFALLSLSLHSEQNFWLVWILLHDLANLQPGCPMLVVICFHIHVIPLIISLFFERLRGITASGRHCCVNDLVCRLDLTRL